MVVPRIRDQVYRVLLEREEARRQARATKVKKAKKKQGSKQRKEKTERVLAKPVVRLGPFALCQEIEFLEMINEFDYELSDAAFQEYCAVRGTLSVAGVPGSRRWEFFADPSKSKAEYLADPTFYRTGTPSDAQAEMTHADLDAAWRVITLGRAKLQDCWELFRFGPDES